MYQAAVPELSNKTEMTAWLTKIEERLNSGLPTGTSYQLQVEKQVNDPVLYINVRFNRHGINTDYHIPGEFFASTEYQRILAFADKINGFVY